MLLVKPGHGIKDAYAIPCRSATEQRALLAQIDDEQQHLQHHPHPHHYNLGEWAAGADFGEPREFNYYAEVGAARLILGGWADLKRGRGGCVDVSEL